MKLALAAIAALLIAGSSFGAETQPAPAKSAVEGMDAKVKAERIEKVAANLARDEKILASLTPERIERARKVNPNLAAGKEREKVRCEAALPQYRVELRWLKGELTPAGTEAAVKAAEEALAKEKPPTDASKAALAKATAERDEIARLEAAEKPKTPEPN